MTKNQENKFCTKREIDSFINLSDKTLDFILSKYTNYNTLGYWDKFGNKIKYERHGDLSKMCIMAKNIKCMRSLSYHKNCYFDYDKKSIDMGY